MALGPMQHKDVGFKFVDGTESVTIGSNHRLYFPTGRMVTNPIIYDTNNDWYIPILYTGTGGVAGSTMGYNKNFQIVSLPAGTYTAYYQYVEE